MAFTDSVKDSAFRRSGGQCECKRTTHGHIGRCLSIITRHVAEYHHVVSEAAGGSDGLENCEALCVTCHQKTKSYGAH
ncbi:MAG: HNH endonuclease [Planctomycetota bacterium]